MKKQDIGAAFLAGAVLFGGTGCAKNMFKPSAPGDDIQVKKYILLKDTKCELRFTDVANIMTILADQQRQVTLKVTCDKSGNHDPKARLGELAKALTDANLLSNRNDIVLPPSESQTSAAMTIVTYPPKAKEILSNKGYTHLTQ